MKPISLRLAVLLAGLAFVLFLTVPPTSADEWNRETKITPDHQIEVPGAVLDANTTYVIGLMDSPAERKVVRVFNQDRSQMLTQFIAISAEKMQPSDETVFEFMEVPAGHPVPVEKWFYPGRTIGLEFLYSKEDRDKFASYWKQDSQTEQVAQLETSVETPAVVEAPAAIEETTVDTTTTVDQAAIEEPTVDDTLRSKPTETEEAPLIAQNTEPATTEQDLGPAATEELPRTAGELQLFGLIGALSATLGLSLRMKRR
jgi:hypothetical protein